MQLNSAPYLANDSTAASATQPASGGYAHWDDSTNTLTLNNYTYWGEGYVYSGNGMSGDYKKNMTAAIYGTADFSIEPEGTNSLTNTDLCADKKIGGGIVGNGCNLTIKGTGSLAISAAYNGIYVGKCNTTISGSANVTAQSAGGQIRHSIYTDGAFTVSGTPTVTANAGTSTSGAQINAGIYAKGTVSITGGNSADISYGVLRKER